MEKRRTGQGKKWPAAVLATAVLAGGVYALPHVFADGQGDGKSASSADSPAAAADRSGAASSSAAVPVAPQAAAASVVKTAAVSTAKPTDAQVVQPIVSVDSKKASAATVRTALVKLEVMSIETLKHFSLDPSDKNYVKLIEARNRANEVASDLDAPADRIFSASRKLEEALDRYNDQAVGGTSAVKKVFSLAEKETAGTSDASGRLAAQGLKEAQAKLASGSGKADALSAYKLFLTRAAEANDIAAFTAADYSATLKQYDANLSARLESAGGQDLSDLQDAYKASVAALESAIDDASGKNALDAAQAAVETTYQTLAEGATLAQAINGAEPLLDSPAGKEKGQYPASAIGTLKRAINKASTSLEKSGTKQQLTEARQTLADAVSDFKGKINK
ncbi:hypothetical protein QWJ34_06840 [Saccharibacillus sp. CPCC 101409]|uniref:hypothetical protein n=1 Tax=Saccharibacillus sp. CPCC 101409 TaxID=3058041 RepID=UPI002673173A|nr:hypothetical protein [Saccharibacillus sp. CPCC 101409]MDO3409474.1 hypothetical protein [Saccharibacillus sp. CPCC 101409]